MKVVIATHNKDKLKEIKELLEHPSFTIISVDQFPNAPVVKEDGNTFADNACKKALKIARISKQLTLADDSGLVVEALDGAPGVHSARFSGQKADSKSNNKKLLKLLEKVPKTKRKARFICSVAIADAKGIIAVVEGICRGVIITEEKGKMGFGYDPLFVYSRYKKTFAQLHPAVKNRISHRARAFKKAKKVILDYIRQQEK